MHRLQPFQLYLQHPCDHIVLLYRWDLDCYLNISSLFLTDLESHFLEILEPIITADREYILV